MSGKQPVEDSPVREEVVDLYARGVDTHQEPPRGVRGTLRYLGPGLILVGSIVGSGELIMTTKLGAQAGFVLLWFVLLSCVIKTVVQGELARHVISSGQTFLVMFNKLPGPRGRRPIWLCLPWMAVVVVTSVAALAISTRTWAQNAGVLVPLAIVVPLSWAVSAWIIAIRRRRREAEADGGSPRAVISWFLWLWLACQLVMFINGGAILGGAGQALELAARKPIGPTFLFSVPVGPQDELDASQISDSLRRAFQDNGQPLPENASVSVVEPGREWQIDAQSRPYVARRTGEALDIYGPTSAVWWTIGVAAFCGVLLLLGRYKTLERVSVGLVCTFTLITVVCTALLQWTGNAITWSDVQQGLSFRTTGLSTTVILTALAMYAGTGIGTWEMMHYTYWCVEKGYARNTGTNQPGEAWPRRARGWVRVMYTDALLTMVVFTLSTVCFYFLGAAILHPAGLDPDGTETIGTLENIFTGSIGPSSATLFVVGAFVVLFSTTFSSAAGSSRLMADGLCVMGLVDPNDYQRRLRFIRIFVVFALAMSTLTYWCLQSPPLMLIIASFVSIVLYPILGLGTLYFRYRGVDGRIVPSSFTTAWLWICGLTLALVSPAAGLILLAVKQGWVSW